MAHPANPDRSFSVPCGRVGRAVGEGREAEVLNGQRLFLSVERGAEKKGDVITDAEGGLHLMSYVFFWGQIVKDSQLAGIVH